MRNCHIYFQASGSCADPFFSKFQLLMGSHEGAQGHMRVHLRRWGDLRAPWSMQRWFLWKVHNIFHHAIWPQGVGGYDIYPVALRANPPRHYLQSKVVGYPERDGRILTFLLNIEVSGRSCGCLGGSFGASGGPGSIRGLREGLQGVLGELQGVLGLNPKPLLFGGKYVIKIRFWSLGDFWWNEGTFRIPVFFHDFQ